MTRYHINGAAVQTTVSGTVASSGAVSITIGDASGWPDASVGPYACVIDPGQPNEEVVLVTARAGAVLTVTSGNRGWDGTTAAGHTNGAVIYPCIAAMYVDEANLHQENGSVHLGAGTIQASHFGTGAVDSTALASSAVTEAKLGSNAVTSTKIAASAVGEAAIASSAVTEAKLGTGAVSAAKLASDAVTTVKILNANVTTAKLADGAVSSAKLADGNVTAAKLEPGLQPVIVELTAAASMSGGTTAITWDSAVADDLGFWTSGSSIVVPSGAAGIYVISLIIDPSSTITRTAGISIVDAGTGYNGVTFGAEWGGTRDASHTLARRLSAGATVQGWRTTSGEATLNCRLTMVRVAP